MDSYTACTMKPARAALLPLLCLLAACTYTVPPRDNAQWVSVVHGVTISWRWVTPGSLAGAFTSLGHRPDDTDTPRYAGFAITTPLAQGCVVDIDPALSRGDLVRVAAHEAGHCLSGYYVKVSMNTEGLSAYHQQLFERYAEHYARLYVEQCGYSLRPLGWYDLVEPKCDAPPDPREIEL